MKFTFSRSALALAVLSVLAGNTAQAQTARYEFRQARPGLAVGAPVQPGLTVSAAPLDFGTITRGTGLTKQLTLTSSGTAPLALTLPFSVTGGPTFSLLSTTCGVSLSPGASCVANVRFAPATTADYSGSLNVASNAAGSPLAIPLLGKAAEPPAGVSLSTSYINFGVVRLGQSPVSSVVLTSTSDTPLLIDSIALEGSLKYSSTTNCGGSLSPKLGTCTVSITFTPDSFASQTGYLRVRTNDGTNPLRSVTLSGSGEAAILGASPATVDFGTWPVGLSATKTVTFTNTGNLRATTLYPTVSGNGVTISASTCGTQAAPGSLSANSSCSVTLAYTPTSSGSLSEAELTLNSAVLSTPVKVALSGAGQSAESSTFAHVAMVRTLVVQESGEYFLDAKGAQGGASSWYPRAGGRGARVVCRVNLTAGTKLKVLVGQQGTGSTYYAGGGGGTFVALEDNTPLCVAGGGGGAASSEDGREGRADFGGAGEGGGTDQSLDSIAAGGGFVGNGEDSYMLQGGRSFVNGGGGGTALAGQNTSLRGGHANGGFGGGSAGGLSYYRGGNGGGYVGGSAGAQSGAGGTSYSAGTPLLAVNGHNTGNGSLTILAPSANAVIEPPMGTLTVTSGSAAMAAVQGSTTSTTVTLKNTSSVAMTGVAPQLSGAGSFSIAATTCAATLSAGSSCTITVDYAPLEAEQVTATLSIGAAVYGGPLEVSFTGTGQTLVDPHLASVKLLLGEGNAGTAVFSDESFAPPAITAYGNVTWSSTQKRFGNTAIYFDGSGDYLRGDGALSTATTTGTPFTLEAWAYQTVAGKPYVFGINSKASGYNAALLGTTSWGWANGTTTNYTVGATATLNVWVHYAMSFDGATVRVFRNGEQVGSKATASPGVALSASVLGIGAEFDAANGATPGDYFGGYLDDVRVTIGVARYLGPFTPLNAPAPRQ